MAVVAAEIPTTMKAFIGQKDKTTVVVHDHPVPQLRPGYLLVRVKAVALNPTDWKHAVKANTAGCVFGMDYAGVVAKTGTGYNTKWKVGDRIAGAVNGANEESPQDGAFAEYIVAGADIAYRIPDNMSYEDASTFGVASLTNGSGLFQKLEMNLPGQLPPTKEPVLIYGGSTATGTNAIQLAALAGYSVYATCSARNFDLVKSLGATEAFDYNDSESAAKIRGITDNKLMLAWDTVGGPGAQFCADVLAPGATYCAVQIIKCPRDDVTSKFVMAYTAMGEAVNKPFIPFHSDRNPVDHEFAKSFAKVFEGLLARGELKAHPPLVSSAGLEGIADGFEMMKEGKISGQKLVYTL